MSTVEKNLICLAYPERGIYVYTREYEGIEHTIRLHNIYLLGDFYKNIFNEADKLNINTIYINDSPFGKKVFEMLTIMNKYNRKEILLCE